MHSLDQIITMQDKAATREYQDAIENGNIEKAMRIVAASSEARPQELKAIFGNNPIPEEQS